MSTFSRGLCTAVSLLAIATTARAETANPSSDQDIVVTAPRLEEDARTQQRLAPVLVNVQSAETIQKYPDYNSAEALGRIPGISLSSDTGEGRFVNIRGIDANLNGATYGGVVLLNTFPAGTAASGSGRAVEFDTIPTGAIDGIVVYKTLSPDREAEGLGGQIELTPRTAKNLSRPFLDATFGAGYEPLHRHGGPYTADIAVGARLGAISFVLTGSRKDDQRAVDDTEPSYKYDGKCLPNGQLGSDANPVVNGGTGCSAPLSMVLGRTDFRRYDYSRRRFGYGGELAFKPSADHSYYIRADVAGYIERALKNHFYANFDGKPSAPDATGYVVDKFQPQIDVIDLQETHRNTVLTAGGADRFGKLEVDYRLAYSRATYLEGYYNEARFFGQDAFYGRYNNMSDPKRFYYQFYKDAALTVPFVSTDATQYGAPNGPTKLTSFFERDRDHEYSGALNVRYPANLFGGSGQIKAGLSIRRRSKIVDDFGAFGQTTLNLSAITQSVGPNETYYFGRYPVAPIANFGATDAAVRAALAVLPQSLGRDFNDQENVTAAYAMYTGTYGRLGLLAGVRVEATDATYGNFFTTTDAAGNSSLPISVSRNKKYTNFFPTVQLKYEFQPSLQLRATYSTGIARPGFSQAGGNAGVDFTTTPRPQYSAGNPDLKPTTGNNFDVDVEYYLPGGGIIQLGAFDKEFKNYIFRSARINVADPVFQGQNGDFISYFNEDAYARGIEVAYQQKFVGLPGPLAGFGVEGNLTLVWSNFLEYSAAVSGDGKDQFSRLPGTSHLTWNISGFYEYAGVSLRLAAQYVGPSVFALNGDKTLDVIQAERLTMDFTGSYAVSKHYAVFFSAKNILNTPLRYNDGSDSRPQQIEYYGPTYEAGVRIKL